MTTPPTANASEAMVVDVPTQRVKLAGKVLVTGASGYIGGRLVAVLANRGYDVRVMVRAPSPEYAERWPACQIVAADALDVASLRSALQGVDTAYYLIHSMLMGRAGFAAADMAAARNFRDAAEAAGVRRIIYLGGLGDTRTQLSRHLQSRMDVARVLMASPIPTTVLRAAVIIGSGSASYEMMKNLVQNPPFILLPPWARTRCQPISIRDVIIYLVGVLENPATSGRAFDIGGREILSYESMLRILADVLGIRRLLLHSPVSSIRLYAYFVSLVTPVPHAIIRCLIESTANEVVCQESDIRTLLPFEPTGYREAIVRALTREEQDAVHSRWSDAYPPAHELALKLGDLARGTRYTATHSLVSTESRIGLFRSICGIGGREGWFHNNWLWRLRGALDRVVMGVGSSRGRRQSSRLRINDVVDFWRVEDLRPGRRLLLRAEMKLPGRGWLEFRLEDADGGRTRIVLTAYFDTASLGGKMYWYASMPLHWFVLGGLLQQIESRGKQQGRIS